MTAAAKTHDEPVKKTVDAVPGDDKSHAHSHAARLESEGSVHLSPQVYGKQGREAGSIQQPPQDPRRNGKTHTRE